MLLSLDLLTARVRLYGITTMQTFAYYRNYRNDTTMLKFVVCTSYLTIHPLIIGLLKLHLSRSDWYLMVGHTVCSYLMSIDEEPVG